MQISAEMRWFWNCPVAPEALAWFCSGPFSPGGGGKTLRRDVYLVDMDQDELGLKKRGANDGVEVKGLVAVLRDPIAVGSTLVYPQIWTKWLSHALTFESMPTQSVCKTRWLRKFSISGGKINEIPLGEDEKPLTGRLPDEGCNVELTDVFLERAGVRWMTIGFEAFGELSSVEGHLRRVIEHLVASKIPRLSAGRQFSYPAWLNGLDKLQVQITGDL